MDLPSPETCQLVSYTYHRGTPPNRYALVDMALLAPVVDASPQIYEYEIILGSELHRGQWIVATNSSARCVPKPPPHIPVGPDDICVPARPNKSAWRRISPRLIADVNIVHARSPDPSPACVQTPATIVNFPYVAYSSQDLLIGRTNQQLLQILYNTFSEDSNEVGTKKRKGNFVRFPNIRGDRIFSGRRKLLSIPILTEEPMAVLEPGSGSPPNTTLENNLDGYPGLGDVDTFDQDQLKRPDAVTVFLPGSTQLTKTNTPSFGPSGDPTPPTQLNQETPTQSPDIPEEALLPVTDQIGVSDQTVGVVVASSARVATSPNPSGEGSRVFLPVPDGPSWDPGTTVDDDYLEDTEDLNLLGTEPVHDSSELSLGNHSSYRYSSYHYPNPTEPAHETSAPTYPRDVSPTTPTFPQLETARLVDIFFLGGLLIYAVIVGLVCLCIYAHTHAFSKKTIHSGRYRFTLCINTLMVYKLFVNCK
ncbi:gG [Macropodid alphaherpesvirus 1]|uniref:GG n=1 Tax=Macropodid alphaherpesvirus 1 TaxID=137443 RepID=A0A0Y0A7L1_9ALPH|nr:gG [Macropodid alphaherpesvirus 1]AMB17023.1 gG [Macropodid alphaherpesvirus 1]